MRFYARCFLSFFLSALIGGPAVHAAFPTSGNWASQTVTGNTPVNVILTDDVKLKGPIIIESGATLNITRSTTQDDGGTDLIRITIASDFTVPSGCKNCMFWVKEGGTLTIDGINQGYAIGLKASYRCSLPVPYDNGEWKTKDEYEAALKTVLAYTVAADNMKVHDFTGGGVIYAVGNVNLKAARIYDAYSSGDGAAIYRPKNDASLNYTYGTVSLNNTRISQCVAKIGPALLVYNQRSDKNGYGSANTDVSCKVTLTNSTKIFENVSSDGSTCGAIRTGDGVVGDMELTNTEIYNNLSYGAGAGIFWNAHGDEAVDTRLSFKQCKIYNNKSLSNGGGLALEATFEFLKGTAATEIRDNIAVKNGGGIWCCIYNGVTVGEEQVLDFGLNENVQLLNNSAVCGGGIAYEMRDTTSLAKNSTLNMTIGGAVIEGNTASHVGGGIYFRSNNSKLNTNLVISGGSIKGNSANEHGGGIYAIKGPQLDVSKCMVKLNSGTISGNKALEGSGGGVSVYGLKVQSDTDADGILVQNNEALKYYGGGIHLEDGASFTMNSGNVKGNTSVSSGGGIFVRDSEMIQNGGTISGNTSGATGGGVYVRGQSAPASFTVNSGAISGNTAAESGGGVYLSKNTTAIISGGDIFDNTATNGNGGGVFCVGNLKIDGGTIGKSGSPNKAPSTKAPSAEAPDNDFGLGGGICISSEVDNGVTYVGSCVVNDGNISYNESGRHGAGIYTKGPLTVSGGTFSNNTSSQYGGAMYLASGTSQVSIKGGTISSNNARFGAGVFAFSGVCEMTGGSVSRNIASVGGGGMYLSTTVYVKGNTSITENQANGDNSTDSSITNSGGGGVLVAGGGNFYMSGNSVISGNTCVTYGAGVRARYGAGEIIIDNGEISSNVADVSGGGMALFGGSITLNGGSISDNTCTRLGGGVYVSECSSFTLSDGVISSNTTTGSNGGGLYFAASAKNITISGGTIEGNTAGNGGGIATDAALTLNGGVIIKENVASGNGGGIYIGADVLVSMEGGEISGNTSKHRGGGIAVYYGNLSIDGGKILNNVAETICGGGVHLTPNSSNTNKVTISNGLISGNSSTSGNGGGVSIIGGICEISGGSMSDNRSILGGGIYQSGGTLTITGGDIISNEARNGGGAFVTGSGVSMSFTNGIIRNNLAKDLSGRTLTTGYDYTVSGNALSLQGTGGGIFVQDGASLTISGDAVGIYGNQAETIADDIYSNGKGGAKVVLPDVSAMDLTGYNSKTSELYWVEDYMTGDTGYANGTAIGGAGHSAVRYRDAIAAQSTVYKVPAGTYAGKYLALSIGYEVIYVTLQRTGLQAGESAIYRIFRIDNGVPSVYSEVLLTGSAGAPVQSKRVALYSGKWRVEETLWTWTYVPPAAIERDITGSTDAQNKVFSFTAAKKESVPEHAEDIVVNDFGAGAAVTGSYLNSGSINDLQNTTDYQLK